jgi:hypothetical protein
MSTTTNGRGSAALQTPFSLGQETAKASGVDPMGIQDREPTTGRAELHDLLAYWQGKRGQDGRLPSRADIDPIELRFALGHLVLVEVERGERLRFRHRLVGSHIVERAGYDATGKYLDEIPEPELADRLAVSYGKTVATKEPVWERIDEFVGHRLIKMQMLRLPLAADGATVDMVLTGAYFERAA